MKRATLMAALAVAMVFRLDAGLALAGEVIEVTIGNYKFQPETVTIKAGTTVKWTNNEKRATHSIWFKGEAIPESERLLSGDSFERSFDKPGTYPYTCGPHPEMHGVVEVTP